MTGQADIGRQQAADEHRRARVAAIIAAGDLRIADHDHRADLATALFGRPVDSWNGLTSDELRTIRRCYLAYPLIRHQRREVLG